jgi:hypothetical protein|tara:strand:- start:38 stop:262 length:225 start_codon:yes stop_codon:yes gene_type:complete
MLDVERSFLLLLLPTMILSVFPTNPELKNCVFFDEYKNAALLEDDDDEDGEQEEKELRESDAARVMEFNEEASI